MINAGGFQPLDDLIAEYGKDMLEKDKDKSFLGAGRYKGQLYGIPTIPSAPGNGGALYMRKDVFDQLDTTGMDVEGYIGYEELDSLLSQIPVGHRSICTTSVPASSSVFSLVPGVLMPM